MRLQDEHKGRLLELNQRYSNALDEIKKLKKMNEELQDVIMAKECCQRLGSEVGTLRLKVQYMNKIVIDYAYFLIMLQ